MARALKKNNFENKINRAGSENVSRVASQTPSDGRQKLNRNILLNGAATKRVIST
jgi:hypothetical protein